MQRTQRLKQPQPEQAARARKDRHTHMAAVVLQQG